MAMTVELVAVERMLWSGEGKSVTAQTTEGEIGILPGHEPMLAELVENGVVTVTPESGDKLVAVVQGGFLSVTQDRTVILADSAQWVTELDQELINSEAQSDDPGRRNHAHAASLAMSRAQGK